MAIWTATAGDPCGGRRRVSEMVRNLSPNEKRKRRTSQSMEINCAEGKWGAVREVGEQKIRGGQAALSTSVFVGE
jgi:hypothetical protein